MASRRQADETPKMKSLYWALNLLDYFDDQHKNRGVSELAELTGLPKSSVCNALSTFEQCGFLRKRSTTGKYALAPKGVCLSYAYSAVNDDAIAFQKECRIISDRLDAIVHVGALVDHKVIYLACTYPARYPQEAMIGKPIPMHCTAVGKAVLAFLPPEEQQRVLSSPLPACTANTITDPEALRLELEKIRRQDYAVDNMESDSSMRSVAIPLHHLGHKDAMARYAISVTMPYTRMPEESVLEYVKIIQDTHREFTSSFLK